jgi:hypothetical protein
VDARLHQHLWESGEGGGGERAQAASTGHRKLSRGWLKVNLLHGCCHTYTHLQGPFNQVPGFIVPVALDFGQQSVGILNMGAGAVLYLQKIVSNLHGPKLHAAPNSIVVQHKQQLVTIDKSRATAAQCKRAAEGGKRQHAACHIKCSPCACRLVQCLPSATAPTDCHADPLLLPAQILTGLAVMPLDGTANYNSSLPVWAIKAYRWGHQ